MSTIGDAMNVDVTPTNEVAGLFNGDANLDADFAKMQQDDAAYVEPTIPETPNVEAKVDEAQNKPDERQSQTESTAKDESAKPQGNDEQHSNNYKKAMEEERREKYEFKKALEQTREENEKLKSLFERLTKPQQQEQQEKPIPSYEDDPIEHLRQRAERAEKVINDLQTKDQKQTEVSKQHEAMNQLVGIYQNKVNEFRGEAPDFNDAYKFAVEAKMKEYAAFGYSNEQAAYMANEDELAIVTHCLKNGMNPAQKIYEFAKMRGYQGRQGANDSQQKQGVTNLDKINMMEQGIGASKSIDGGGQKKLELTLDAVAAMSDKELEELDWTKVLALG